MAYPQSLDAENEPVDQNQQPRIKDFFRKEGVKPDIASSVLPLSWADRPALRPVGDRFVDYLPIQKLEKMRPSRSSELNAPVISPSACCAMRRSSASSSPAPASVS